MHEWKNYYIFCFTAVLPHFEDKDLITNALWDRISQTGLCPVIFAHCAMVQAPTIKLAALSNVWNFGQLEAEKKEF